MRVLIACEYSGRVRDAFIAKGHDAISCDILDTESPGPHIKADVLTVINDGWDMMIAFPPCQYLTATNGWRWDEIELNRGKAIAFVLKLMLAPIDRIAIENPQGAISTHIRKADQTIQPWHYGDPYEKRTCLWLKRLPKLVPAVTEKPDGVTQYMKTVRSPHKRSLTFHGIARAMAEQWGEL